MSRRIFFLISIISIIIVTFFGNVFALNYAIVYDELHRVIRLDYSDGTNVIYNYDNLGNRTSKIVTVANTTIDAQFTSDLTNGLAPLQVAFTDQSVGNITSWEWNFGDGQTSTEQHPVHSYADPGTYTVSLTVNGPDGSDAISIPSYITVGDGQGSPVLSVSPSTRSVSAGAGSTIFSVDNTGSGVMNWTAVSNDSWLTIAGGSPGTDSGVITVSYTANDGAVRTGSATVTAPGASNSPQTVTVSQAQGAIDLDLSANSPAGGEVWTLGSTYAISWTASSPFGINEIRLYYHYNGETLSIVTLDGQETEYAWTIPGNGAYISQDARIRIVAFDGNGGQAEIYSPSFSVQDGESPPPPWQVPEKLTTSDNSQNYISQSNSRGAIATDSLGNVHLAYLFTQDDLSDIVSGGSGNRIITQKIFYRKKTGGTWSAPTELYSLTSTTDSNLIGHRPFSELRIAVDAQDNPHIAWVFGGANTASCDGWNGNEIYAVSFDGTAWLPPVNVSNNATYSYFLDIAADTAGNVHFVWIDGRTFEANSCTSSGTRTVYHGIRFANGDFPTRRRS